MDEKQFDKIQFADAQITKLSYEDTSVMVSYKDWRENSHSIKFTDVLWFEALLLMGQDLSHGLEQKKHPTIEEMCRKVGESSYNYVLYSLVSASTDNQILTIVAKHFEHT
jgi:hypothetical protein